MIKRTVKQNLPILVVVAILAVGLLIGTILALNGHSETAAQAKYEAAFPSLENFPTPPGSRKDVEYKPNHSAKISSARWITSSSYYAVAKFYIEKLPQDDWQVINSFSDSESDNTYLIRASKGSVIAHISIENDSDKSQTFVTVQLNKY